MLPPPRCTSLKEKITGRSIKLDSLATGLNQRRENGEQTTQLTPTSQRLDEYPSLRHRRHRDQQNCQLSKISSSFLQGCLSFWTKKSISSGRLWDTKFHEIRSWGLKQRSFRRKSKRK